LAFSLLLFLLLFHLLFLLHLLLLSSAMPKGLSLVGDLGQSWIEWIAQSLFSSPQL
jgi:hypothetical protein